MDAERLMGDFGPRELSATSPDCLGSSVWSTGLVKSEALDRPDMGERACRWSNEGFLETVVAE